MMCCVGVYVGLLPRGAVLAPTKSLMERLMARVRVLDWFFSLLCHWLRVRIWKGTRTYGQKDR